MTARPTHQRIRVFENARFGRVLTLDGVVQTTEGDEFIYHEMMAHVPILAHGAARRVLIVGGGDGGMAREVLRHRAVEHVTMVEIDAGVVEFSKKYLPSLSAGAFDDPRLDLVIADGADFVAQTDRRFDVAIIDSTDPVGPGEVLFTDTFYGRAKRCLAPGGVLVTQNGVPFMQGDELAGTRCAPFARCSPTPPATWPASRPIPAGRWRSAGAPTAQARAAGVGDAPRAALQAAGIRHALLHARGARRRLRPARLRPRAAGLRTAAPARVRPPTATATIVRHRPDHGHDVQDQPVADGEHRQRLDGDDDQRPRARPAGSAPARSPSHITPTSDMVFRMLSPL